MLKSLILQCLVIWRLPPPLPPPPPPLCFLLNIAGSFSPQALQLRVSSPFSFHLYLLTCQRGLLCNSELTLLPAAEMSFPLSIKQLPEAFAARSTPHLLPQTWGCCRASGRPLVDRKLTAGRDSFLETKAERVDLKPLRVGACTPPSLSVTLRCFWLSLAD